MRAAHAFVAGLKADALLADATRITAELFGSLGATGHGHGSDKAVLLGLTGDDPETVDIDSIPERVEQIKSTKRLSVLGAHDVVFNVDDDLVMHRRKSLPFHPNGMTFSAYSESGAVISKKTYYSVGGGFVVDERATGADRIKVDETRVAYPFTTGARAARAHESHRAADLRDHAGEREVLAQRD